MHQLARAKIDQLKYRSDIFETALAHFGSLRDDRASEILATVVDYAYTDDLLFEEFEIWAEEKNDSALLFQAEHFLKQRDMKALPKEHRDLTGNTAEIVKLRRAADLQATRTFAKRLRELAMARGLDTNEKLGDFLGVTGERARVLLEGKHRPQMKTLMAVAKRFRVAVESLG